MASSSSGNPIADSVGIPLHTDTFLISPTAALLSQSPFAHLAPLTQEASRRHLSLRASPQSADDLSDDECDALLAQIKSVLSRAPSSESQKSSRPDPIAPRSETPARSQPKTRRSKSAHLGKPAEKPARKPPRILAESEPDRKPPFVTCFGSGRSFRHATRLPNGLVRLRRDYEFEEFSRGGIGPIGRYHWQPLSITERQPPLAYIDLKIK